MNVPYRKEYSIDGELLNPITDRYGSKFPNRKKRRTKDGRFNSNRKGVNIVTVLGKTFKKILQKVGDKNIYHYQPINK